MTSSLCYLVFEIILGSVSQYSSVDSHFSVQVVLNDCSACQRRYNDSLVRVNVDSLV